MKRLIAFDKCLILASRLTSFVYVLHSQRTAPFTGVKSSVSRVRLTVEANKKVQKKTKVRRSSQRWQWPDCWGSMDGRLVAVYRTAAGSCGAYAVWKVW